MIETSSIQCVPVIAVVRLMLLLSLSATAADKFPRNTAALTNHWAFQPVRRPHVPSPQTDRQWVRTPVDAFILEKLQQHGLSPSPMADPRTLIRRASFDLTGLPPSMAEVEAFQLRCEKLGVADAFAGLVDELLASPHYGERWARHWLDVARYADTTGYLPKGQKRFSDAHRYRDYFIRALNDDLPYDQFILEQLAADQLPLPDGSPRPLQSMGFLTLGRTFLDNRHDIIDDRIDVVSRGLMGVTVTCARCHDHPHDPVSAEEYYALYGVFTNSLETVEDPASVRAREVFVHEREDIRRHQSTARSKTAEARLQSLAWLDLPSSQMSLGLADAPHPVQAHVFVRGHPGMPGRPAGARFLELASGGGTIPLDHGSGRLQLARAIASPDNPLTSRVLVNHIWRHHFGFGLVRTSGDLGTRCEPPSHPELLDWLATWFMDNGWSQKKLHRLLMTSAVYQQASSGRTQSAQSSQDPDNTLLWRMNPSRLRFESMRDALLAISGRLDRSIGGASVVLTERPFNTRRTLYGYIDRQDVPGLFTIFDFPVPDTLCVRRFETTVPQRALFFLNSEFVREQAAFVAASPDGATTAPIDTLIATAFKTVLQRSPSDAELAGARELVAQANEAGFKEPAWQFGFGEYDPARQQAKGFQRLTLFHDGAWRAGTDLPDKVMGFLSHNANGGHPGRNTSQSCIRRWVSPVSGRISIQGVLSHQLAEGDGVQGIIVSSRRGELGRWQVHEDTARTDLNRVAVQAGDVIDFIVEGGKDSRFDHFVWAPVIRLDDPSGNQAAGIWDARRDFMQASEAWNEKPMNGLEVLVHALFMSNEFMFVD